MTGINETDRSGQADNEPIEVNEDDQLIRDITTRALNKYKAVLAGTPTEPEDLDVDLTRVPATDRAVIQQLDTLQQMLGNWVEQPGLLIPAVYAQKVVDGKKPTFTVRFMESVRRGRMPGTAEYAMPELSLHVNMGVPETVDQALEALSLRGRSAVSVLDSYEIERRRLSANGQNRGVVFAVNTSRVYQAWQSKKLCTTPQAGIQFELNGGDKAAVRGLVYIGRTAFTSDVLGTVSAESFTKMASRTIKLSAGRV